MVVYKCNDCKKTMKTIDSRSFRICPYCGGYMVKIFSLI